MRTLQFALVLTLLVTLGCRSNNGQLLLEQESRMFEDEVYSLEAQLDDCCRAREALAQENADLRRQLAAGGGGGDYRSPASSLPSSSGSRSEAPLLEAPKIELPEPSDTPPDTLLPGDTQPGVLPSDETPPDVMIPGDEQPAAPASGAAVEGIPAKLAINKRLTGGLDHDRAGGDEGIMVMVEPRDRSGHLVKAPGAVSIVVMDPSQTGEAARIARWDFQAHEFDEHFKQSTFGEGLQYELKWPGQPPEHRDLVLFVRYTSPDGEKLTTDAPLAVRLASDYPREPKSRLTSNAPEEAPAARQATEDADSGRGRASREVEGPRQARHEMPEWKPYR